MEGNNSTESLRDVDVETDSLILKMLQTILRVIIDNF